MARQVSRPLPLSTKPMEAEPVDELPSGAGWLFEPKYDGFRCIAFHDGDRIDLQSRNQKPLARYFPGFPVAPAGVLGHIARP